jgi:hypothetical protein
MGVSAVERQLAPIGGLVEAQKARRIAIPNDLIDLGRLHRLERALLK